jgi:CelD/BcsL family acetyltransferase involved in cellulose biosynthesis
VLCVFDFDDRLVGLAPWYLEGRGPSGRVVRLLGSGEVCSDYLGVLCQAGMEDRVTQVMADHLTDLAASDSHDPDRWDLLELEGVDAQDRAVNRLIEHLAERGNSVHRRAGPNCWRIELPSTWDAYLAMLSKSHRRQLRRLQRRLLDSGRAVLNSVRRNEELPRAVDLLVDLHQRRRGTRLRVLGKPGAFASKRFTAFHRAAMQQLLLQRHLQLHWLELDGRPVAAEYHLAADGVIYAYQSGIDPDALDWQPGRLITLATLRQAVEQGYRAFDFLRGDEPYKAHYRAQPRPSLAVRVVPDRAAAQLRHGLWQAGGTVKRWIKQRIVVSGEW